MHTCVNILNRSPGRYTASCAVHHVRMLFDEKRRGALFALASALVFAETCNIRGTEVSHHIPWTLFRGTSLARNCPAP